MVKKPRRLTKPYSITASLRRFGSLPVSIRDDGEPITNEQIAAAWLWHCLVSGMDEPFDIGGVKFNTRRQPEEVPTAIRAQMFREIWRQTDPIKTGTEIEKLSAEAVGLSGIDQMSEEELRALDKLLARATGDTDGKDDT